MESARLEYSLARVEVTLVMNDQASWVLSGLPWSQMAEGCKAMLAERIGTRGYPHCSPDEAAEYRGMVDAINEAGRLMGE